MEVPSQVTRFNFQKLTPVGIMQALVKWRGAGISLPPLARTQILWEEIVTSTRLKQPTEWAIQIGRFPMKFLWLLQRLQPQEMWRPVLIEGVNTFSWSLSASNGSVITGYEAEFAQKDPKHRSLMELGHPFRVVLHPIPL